MECSANLSLVGGMWLSETTQVETETIMSSKLLQMWYFFLHVLCLLLFLKKNYSVIFHIILHLTLLQHVVSMLMAVDVTISDLQETHTMANTHKMLLLQEHGMI